jgi:hypothetical protein
MSTTNLALLAALVGPWPLFINDDMTALAAGGQSGAVPCLRSGANRVTIATAGAASVVLPAVSDDASGLVIVINDSANAIAVFCAPSGTLNGTLNASLSIAAGGFAIFLRVAATLDWRAAAFT